MNCSLIKKTYSRSWIEICKIAKVPINDDITILQLLVVSEELCVLELVKTNDFKFCAKL